MTSTGQQLGRLTERMSASEQRYVELAIANRNDAVLSKINLQSLELAEVDLASIVLNGCQMQSSIVRDSWVGILRRCDMSRMAADNCTFARLSRCIIRNAILNKCKFGAYLIGNVFENVLLSHVNVNEPSRNWRSRGGHNIFHNVTFVSVDLRACVLSRSRFINCKFVRVLLARTNADNTTFESCHFQACNMADGLRHAEINACTFIKCTDRGCDAVRAQKVLRHIVQQENQEIDIHLDLRLSGCSSKSPSATGSRHVVRLHNKRSLGGGYVNDENGIVVRYYGLDGESDLVDLIGAVACDYVGWDVHKARVIIDGMRDATVERSVKDLFSVPLAWWLPPAE